MLFPTPFIHDSVARVYNNDTRILFIYGFQNELSNQTAEHGRHFQTISGEKLHSDWDTRFLA